MCTACCLTVRGRSYNKRLVSRSVRHLFADVYDGLHHFWLIAKFLRASPQIWDSNPLLSVSYLQTHIRTHRDSLYMLSCCLCFFLHSFVCLASHLIFILPQWRIALNVFNYAAFPNQSHTPLADPSAGFFASYPPSVTPSLPLAWCTSLCCLSLQSETLWANASGLQRKKPANA